MADIRRTGLIDDFDRPNETPIQPPWQHFNVGTVKHPRLLAGNFSPANFTGNQSSDAYWTGDSFDAATIEIWGELGGSVDLSEGVRIGWLKESPFQGYFFMLNNSVGPNEWKIQKYDGGTTDLIADDGFPDISADDYVMLRREGNDLVGYWSNNGPNDFLEMMRVTNTAFMSGPFYPLLIIDHDDSNDPVFRGVGGGDIPDWVPQIYRRPNE